MKCDNCIWLIRINEQQALCPFLRCVKDKDWKANEGVNKVSKDFALHK